MTPLDDRRPEPLSEAAFYILLSLASGPRHGYAILKDVETLSRGRILFSTGTLYGALKRFLQWDWIRRVRGRGEDETGRPRKEYALTAEGRRILDAEVSRLQSLVKTARARTAPEAG
jgi:DNA-binding PadR family transcriptional regulator